MKMFLVLLSVIGLITANAVCATNTPNSVVVCPQTLTCYNGKIPPGPFPYAHCVTPSGFPATWVGTARDWRNTPYAQKHLVFTYVGAIYNGPDKGYHEINGTSLCVYRNNQYQLQAHLGTNTAYTAVNPRNWKVNPAFENAMSCQLSADECAMQSEVQSQLKK